MSRQYLRGRELQEQLKRPNVDIPNRGGLKDYEPDSSWLQSKKLQNFYDERREVLLEERIQKIASLAVGEWQSEVGKVLVTRNVGKFWKGMGHMVDGLQMLFPEEALFLMDTGVMDVYYNRLPLSLEEAFTVLLSTEVPVAHYHAYAHLARLGYTLHRHNHPDLERKGRSIFWNPFGKRTLDSIDADAITSLRKIPKLDVYSTSDSVIEEAVIACGVDTGSEPFFEEVSDCVVSGLNLFTNQPEMVDCPSLQILGSEPVEMSVTECCTEINCELSNDALLSCDVDSYEAASIRGKEENDNVLRDNDIRQNEEPILTYILRQNEEPIYENICNLYTQSNTIEFNNRILKLDNWLDFPVENFIMQRWYTNNSTVIPLSPSLNSATVTVSPEPLMNCVPVNGFNLSDLFDPEYRLSHIHNNLMPPGIDYVEYIDRYYGSVPGGGANMSHMQPFGSKTRRLETEAKNWKEYKLELMDARKDLKIVLKSPAAILWSEEGVRPLVMPWMASSTREVLNHLKVIRNVAPSDVSPEIQEEENDLDHCIIYDVYHPDSKFKKSAPGPPALCLCIARQEELVPRWSTLSRLSRQCTDGVPLILAVVDNGDVAFYSFNFVDLPRDLSLV